MQLNESSSVVMVDGGNVFVSIILVCGLVVNGIFNVVLNVYWVVVVRFGNVDFGCGIDWVLFVGIGCVEFDYGCFGGVVFNDDGMLILCIIGLVFDGKYWDYVVVLVDGFVFDGDVKYVHALGLM